MTLPPDVTALLEQLAIKLGVVAEHLWAVIVRQMTIEGTLWMVGGGVAVVVGLALLACSFRLVMAREQCDDSAGSMFVGGFIVAGLGLASVLTRLPLLLNPEFAALNYLLGMVAR